MSNGIEKVDAPGPIQVSEWNAMRDQANVLIRSGFLPATVKTPEQAIAIMMAGREFRIGPMQAIKSLFVVDGRVGMEAKLMKALVHRDLPEATLEVVESADDHCTVKAGRPGKTPKTYTWTIKDAERAELLAKKGETWKKYPRDMLRNRAISEACRSEFPDVIGGAVEREELYEVIGSSGVEAAITYEDPAPLLEALDKADSVKTLNATAAKVAEKAEKGLINAADREALSARYQQRYAALQTENQGAA